jgi:hypothetical protein
MPRSPPVVPAYCLPWHVDRSSAFRKILARPLAPWLALQFIPWPEVPATQREAGCLQGADGPMVFCQIEPPPHVLQSGCSKVVWVPMWDQAGGYAQEWWNVLPRTLRVLALSRAVARRARQAGLRTLEVHYHIDEAEIAPAAWDDGISILYWNRTGLASPRFLKELCTALKADRLYFRGDVDTGVPAEAHFELSQRLGPARVHDVSGIMMRHEYLEVLQRCNVFIAPRSLEGVGLTFLEAMTAGCAVLAFDAPTMNEYISHGVNGLLMRNGDPGLGRRLAARAATLGGRRSGEVSSPPSALLDRCDSRNLCPSSELRHIGEEARKSQRLGRLEWNAKRETMAEFILDW